MKNLKLTIEYDGTKYNGWQRQTKTENTIQSKIEKVLSLMANTEIKIIGSGRTDAGVHALNQIVNFTTKSSITTNEIRDYCNRYLPEDIVVKQVEEVDERFHARYNAKSKKYLYRIWNGEYPTALYKRYSYYVPQQLNLNAMKEAASYLLGSHDFSAFTSAKSKKKSHVREIHSIEFTKDRDFIDITLNGNGFLHNMVRIIVGTLIEVGDGTKKPADLERILKGKVRSEAGPTAPAQGLFLYKVYYD